MPLESIRKMIRLATREGYAIGYFESWNLESLQGVIDAAEMTRSPIIVGFNGDFLSRQGRVAEERLSCYAALGRSVAASAAVPCGLIFNECPRDDWIRQAIAEGFNLVMPSDPDAPPREYVEWVAAIVRLAHSRGVAVEAELGILPCGASGGTPRGGNLTDPIAASDFVAAAGVDLLAVSVGNVHIQVDGSSRLDLAHLEAIRKRVEIPLVLHGGTGIDAVSLKSAIAMGVAKVNFGTYLKQRYLSALRRSLERDCRDPHRLLGMGGPEDVMVAGRLAVRDAVLERIDWLGCRDKAIGGEDR